jgi:hypothetical protein
MSMSWELLHPSRILEPGAANRRGDILVFRHGPPAQTQEPQEHETLGIVLGLAIALIVSGAVWAGVIALVRLLR